ncbi:chorismate mutase [Polytolypa hystricis UAMH7299]|uniref:Chorismate mutase n=1 Tax=Polytolypa hystricis (strain UAMH7299) TaxID=1447883 RepID=A0A2B7Y6K4_POLH7|nr:chorismate mutase [Polytolypa hystricis UAMH7299]
MDRAESHPLQHPHHQQRQPARSSQSPPAADDMDTAIDLSDATKALDLDNIRFQLIRLEDTITFHLIERVQFPLNKRIYTSQGVKIPGCDLSLMEYLLHGQERLQSRVRRYQSPDEYPFFPDALETPILQPLEYPKILHDNDVNVNDVIKSRYINEILPHACRTFDREDRGETQENYGSAATCDVNCLQALSRRIHFGKFVAESKFRDNPEKFVKLIKAADREGIDEAITNKEVERKVLERLRLKARTYGTDPANPANPDVGNEKINVEAVVAMYKNSVIPMTKIVEVEYLMQRLKGTEWENS